ncbi:MAG TPA: hypothetical protein VFB60_06575 [Ktedonobacteraceae bacterium]|nr:hypothetical protein [Ktedonobacteraceae bacterium]
MQKNPFIHALSAKFCLLMLGILLLLAACSSTGSPSSQPAPGNTPQPTSPPSNGGYSIITLLQQEMHFFLAPYNP